MKTEVKNLVLKAIEQINVNSFWKYKVEDIKSDKNSDGSLDWKFLVFQFNDDLDYTVARYRSMLSDPTHILNLLSGMGCSFYISVDNYGPEIRKDCPYIRAF